MIRVFQNSKVLKNKIFFYSYVVSITTWFYGIFIWAFYKSDISEQIPFWMSMQIGEQRLTYSSYFPYVFFFLLIIQIFHFFIIEKLMTRRKKHVAMAINFLNLFISILFCIAAVRILMVTLPNRVFLGSGVIEFLILGFGSYFLSLGLISLANRIYTKINLIDDLTRKHAAILSQDKKLRGGAMPVLIAIVAISAFYSYKFTQLLLVSSQMLILGIIGLIDDKKDVKPQLRLLFLVIISLLTAIYGYRIGFFTSPITHNIIQVNIYWISVLLTTVYLIWIMNALSWSHGVDGQFPLMACAAFFFLTLIGFRDFEKYELFTKISWIAAFSILAFLPFNWSPSKIILGFGATGFGYLLGVLSIAISAKVGIGLIILSLPMVDSIIVILKRISSRQNPLISSKTHFHHILLRFSLTHAEIAAIYFFVTLIMGFIAVNVSERFALETFAFVAISLTLIILITTEISRKYINTNE